jgi:hypothetical protein
MLGLLICTGIRAARYWPAIVAMTRCPAIKAFAERLAKRGKATKVTIGAVMGKLVHICYACSSIKPPTTSPRWLAAPLQQRKILLVIDHSGGRALISHV